MSGNFNRNLEVAQGLEATIRNELSRLTSAPGINFQSASQHVDNLIRDLQQKIGGLRGQVNSMGPDEREMYLEDITELDKSCSQFRSQLQAANQRAGAQQQVQSQHDNNMQKGNQIANKLDESLAIGNDTLQTQQNTMNTLAEDQKHLDNVESNLSVVDSEASTGERTAIRMYRRQLMIRIISWSIVAVLLALFIFSLVWKLKPE
ncbi:hypothetical protein M9Y10_009780 [Tritrichomonas musculus]|uniref:t-SNARE coiled-coil homology domain-containing protein n=1 Tax=Tritrichomonas musculus TaxID=1915356 RepID=A0ABR2IPJ2_9EUKA